MPGCTVLQATASHNLLLVLMLENARPLASDDDIRLLLDESIGIPDTPIGYNAHGTSQRTDDAHLPVLAS